MFVDCGLWQLFYLHTPHLVPSRKTVFSYVYIFFILFFLAKGLFFWGLKVVVFWRACGCSPPCAPPTSPTLGTQYDTLPPQCIFPHPHPCQDCHQQRRRHRSLPCHHSHQSFPILYIIRCIFLILVPANIVNNNNLKKKSLFFVTI